jgi:hypothetical protein
MDEMQRKYAILHALFSQNPSLAGMIQETDEEGIALYGACYVLGVDLLRLTRPEHLLIPDAVYEQMRATMTRQPRVALNN